MVSIGCASNLGKSHYISFHIVMLLFLLTQLIIFNIDVTPSLKFVIALDVVFIVALDFVLLLLR